MNAKRKAMIAGNWKMNLGRSQAVQLARALASGNDHGHNEVVICPPFVHLEAVAAALSKRGVKLGAQDAYFESSGAFTGEVSAAMLKDFGCEYVIIGHSERRQIFGESDALINKKLRAVLACGMTPIFCVGETLQERETNQTFRVIERQLAEGLSGIGTEMVIAYEPVWAIGSGKVATSAQAQEVHAFIRGKIAKKNSRILYGGSVKADNIGELAAMEDIDGALVGGASLKAEEFLKIIEIVNHFHKEYSR